VRTRGASWTGPAVLRARAVRPAPGFDADASGARIVSSTFRAAADGGGLSRTVAVGRARRLSAVGVFAGGVTGELTGRPLSAAAGVAGGVAPKWAFGLLSAVLVTAWALAPKGARWLLSGVLVAAQAVAPKQAWGLLVGVVVDGVVCAGQADPRRRRGADVMADLLGGVVLDAGLVVGPGVVVSVVVGRSPRRTRAARAAGSPGAGQLGVDQALRVRIDHRGFGPVVAVVVAQGGAEGQLGAEIDWPADLDGAAALDRHAGGLGGVRQALGEQAPAAIEAGAGRPVVGRDGDGGGEALAGSLDVALGEQRAAVADERLGARIRRGRARVVVVVHRRTAGRRAARRRCSGGGCTRVPSGAPDRTPAGQRATRMPPGRRVRVRCEHAREAVMTSPGPACVRIADAGLRDLVCSVLAGRGYQVRRVDDDALIEALRAGETAVISLGAGEVDLEEVAPMCDRWRSGMLHPIVALVDRSDGELAAAAVGAGINHVRFRPIDAADLDLEMALAERRAAERGRMLSTLRAMPDRIAVHEPGGELIYANHERPGPLDDLLACSRLDELSAEVRAVLMPAFERARAGQLDVVEIESEGVHCRVRLVPTAGPGGNVALIATDITWPRRVEQILRASVVKADALLDALPDMMFRIGGDGVFTDFQPEWAEKLAGRADRLVGRQVAEALPPAIAARTLDAFAVVLGTGKSQRFEFQLAGAGGQANDYEARLSAAGPNEVLAIVHDITEAKRLQAQLALADRLAALGTLAAGVAHEVNNPLTYVLIGIESVVKELRRRGPDAALGARLDPLLERLQGAMEGARRVRRIVSELRSLARVDEQDQRPIDVCVVLDSAASMVEGQLRHRGSLVREYRAGLPPVLGRQDRLGQVFLNLLLNAAHAVQEGRGEGVVALRADLDASGRVVVEVEDSGSGFSREQLARIFDPLFTSKPVLVGGGFGLWVSHTIVTSLGGELTARSRVGEGTVFRVVLPVSSQLGTSGRMPAAAPPGEHDAIEALELGRVLIVDDDPHVAESMALLLEGSDVQVAHTGRDGLARALSGEYDWIVCDLMLRDLSGMDLYDEVRRVRPALEQRFVFMTGGAFTARARAFVDGTPCPCLVKPFHPHQLVAAIRGRS
jgi:signal transduction histidine kinase/DNA-binding response OmpR family regulator